MRSPIVVWFTGLSGSGKSTLANALYEEKIKYKNIVLLDGDDLRTGLCSDLNFTEEDRAENIRRVGEVAKLFYKKNITVLCPLISPLEKERNFVRNLFPEKDFIEVFVSCKIERCIKRDVKGMYEKALKGDIPMFTGISSPYEEPRNPELTIKTDEEDIETSVGKLLNFLNGI